MGDLWQDETAYARGGAIRIGERRVIVCGLSTAIKDSTTVSRGPGRMEGTFNHYRWQSKCDGLGVTGPQKW
jgi:hypothetical protein